MQDVTNQWFMKVVAEYGAPDYFFTEFFRVHETSRLDKHILSSITENNTGKPIFAQMIGEDVTALVRIAGELCKYNIAGIDLNLGCPAPRVYRKNVGGGLLRDPIQVDRILGALRQAVDLPLTVKITGSLVAFTCLMILEASRLKSLKVWMSRIKFIFYTSYETELNIALHSDYPSKHGKSMRDSGDTVILTLLTNCRCR